MFNILLQWKDVVMLCVVCFRNTPVPSGPNSFGKSKIGFSQDYKMYERKLMEEIGDPDKPDTKKSDAKPS